MSKAIAFFLAELVAVWVVGTCIATDGLEYAALAPIILFVLPAGFAGALKGKWAAQCALPSI